VVGGKGWDGEKRSEAGGNGEVTQVHELPFAEKWDGIMVMQGVRCQTYYEADLPLTHLREDTCNNVTHVTL
jgi:hypothetical protein